MSIKNWPTRQQPRQKLLNQGPQTLSDSELLAILLRTGHLEHNAFELAQHILERLGSLANIFSSTPQKLLEIPGVGPARAAEFAAIAELQSRCLEQEITDKKALSSPNDCRRMLIARMRHLSHEQFSIIYLDNRHRVLRFETLFRGTIDSSAVYPRTVVELCIQYRAAAVIFAHNHPSGINEPSEADKRITEQLQKALSLIDVRVLDHFIIGEGQPYSMAEQGGLYPC